MFGLPSFRCVHGYRWLKALNLVRGCRRPLGNVDLFHPSLADASYDCSLIKVYSSSSFSDEPDIVKNSDRQLRQTSEKTKISGKSRELAHPLHKDSSSMVDFLLQDDVDLPSKAYIKTAQWHLDEWYETMKKHKKSATNTPLWDVVTARFESIIECSMMQGTPAVIREKCLKLLLMEDMDHDLTKKLLFQTLESSTFLPMIVLSNIVKMLSQANPTDYRTMIRKGLVAQAVNKRWFEISPRYTLFFMYQLDELFDMKTINLEFRSISKSNETTSKSSMNSNDGDRDVFSETSNVPLLSCNVERCVLNVADELKSKDLARILTLMGKWRSRNETLLAAVVHRLNQADLSNFTYVQLSNLLFASSTLAVYNKDLLEEIVRLLLSLEPVSPTLTISVLTSLSHLKWYNPEFVFKCLTYLMDHMQGLTGKDARNILMTLANLYVLPVLEEHKLVIAGNRALSDQPSVLATVNVAWNLAILESLDKDTANLVLEPSFRGQLRETDTFQNALGLYKLNQINTAARLEVDSYDGALVSDTDCVEQSRSVQETVKAESQLRSTLITTLGKYVNPSSYVKVDQKLPGGYTADALLCSDTKGNLKPLAQCEEDNSANLKLAVKVIPFSGVIFPQDTPSGVYQMESRHLRAMGYIPVQVLYSDLHKNKSYLEHVNALQARIKSSVEASAQA